MKPPDATDPETTVELDLDDADVETLEAASSQETTLVLSDEDKTARSSGPASIVGTDEDWFAEAPLVEAAMEPRTRAQVIMRRVAQVTTVVAAIPLALLGFTIVGALSAELGVVHAVAMTGAGALAVALPLGLSWLMRRRYYKPRVLLTIALFNALLLLGLGTLGQAPTYRALSARGAWWIAALSGGHDSSAAVHSQRAIRAAAGWLLASD